MFSLSLIHISEPTRQAEISYAVFCLKKKVKGTALKLPPGLTHPGPCEPMFWKNDLLAHLFCRTYSPKSVMNFHQLFKCFILTFLLICLSKIKACMGVIYLLVFAKKHESTLPTNICTTAGKKTHWYREKCDLLSETTFLPYLMIAWCVFFYQSVCVFTSDVCHVFHYNIMFLLFL